MADYKKFRHTEYLDRAIARDDMKGVRELLCVACKEDRGFSTNYLQDGIEYVEKVKQVQTLWQKFDPNRALFAARVDKGDESLSDEDYFDAVFDLSCNFCLERIEDVKKLGQFLERKEAAKRSAQASKNAVNEQRPSQKKDSSANPPYPAADSSRFRKNLLPVLAVAFAIVILVAAVMIATKAGKP